MKTSKSAFISSLIFRINLYMSYNGNSFVQNNCGLFITTSFLGLIFMFFSLLTLAVYMLLLTFAIFTVLAIVETVYNYLYQHDMLSTFYYLNN